MKNIFLTICLIFTGSLVSQTVSDEDIVGVYKSKSNDPLGSSTTIILPDNTFVIAYFGGIQKGTWELSDEFVLLKLTTEPQFVLYGRNLSNLGNKTQINFQIEASNGVMVGLDSNSKTNLKPVFNQDANCFSYPYLFTQDKELIQLHAAQSTWGNEDYNTEGNLYEKVYHFNILGAYNDLILINLSSQYTTESTIYATYKDGMLYMDPEDEGMQKRALESLNEEDTAFINEFPKKPFFSEQLKPEDEFFPYNENPTQEELKPYNRIDVLEILKEGIKSEGKPFFISTCSED